MGPSHHVQAQYVFLQTVNDGVLRHPTLANRITLAVRQRYTAMYLRGTVAQVAVETAAKLSEASFNATPIRLHSGHKVSSSRLQAVYL